MFFSSSILPLFDLIFSFLSFTLKNSLLNLSMSKPITLNHYKILFNFLQVFKANKLSEIVAPNGAIFCYDEACFIFTQ